jgi:hypothetical protein
MSDEAALDERQRAALRAYVEAVVARRELARAGTGPS